MLGKGRYPFTPRKEGHVVLHHLLVDREGVGQERLILRSLGEDDWFVLAEPLGRDVDGGLDRHVSSLLVVLRMGDSHAALI